MALQSIICPVYAGPFSLDRFIFFIFSTNVVLFRFNSLAALFLTQLDFLRALMISSFSNSLTAVVKDMPPSGISGGGAAPPLAVLPKTSQANLLFQ